MRLVLDTNIALDWLVFRDPRVTPIVAALNAGSIAAWTNASCEAELQRVLGYPQFGLGEHAQASAIDAYRQLVRRHDGAPDPRPLPRCSDTDDQKFLELARDVGASHLVTKDKSLLRLARARHRLRFRIVTPQTLVLPDA